MIDFLQRKFLIQRRAVLWSRLKLLQDQAEAERNSFCNIGRMAEVRFQRKGFGLADQLAKALAWVTGRDSRRAAVPRPQANE